MDAHPSTRRRSIIRPLTHTTAHPLWHSHMIPQVFCLEIVESQVEAMATLHSSDDTSMSANTAEVFLFLTLVVSSNCGEAWDG